ncbi:MAG TPA: hypothetical protein VFT72_11830 [Opitutaceae bacterium]|nr:hypothetical protein [Opitutaceae bacterium]
MSFSSNHSSHRAGNKTTPTAVRYSLQELLAEIDQEKVSGAFGMEKLQQSEIEKVFKAQSPRRRVASGQ